nr:Nif3-like dinuclear metal center hexameric protein [Buchnera aphidicola]
MENHFIMEIKRKYITRVAWCTGRGQNFITEALNFNIDAYITGEVSEETIHIAEENNIHFFFFRSSCY